VERDQSIITNHLKPLFGHRSIGSIKPPAVQAAVDQWTTTHQPSTVDRHFACLRAIFAYAEASEMILRTPCRGIRLPKVRKVDRPVLAPKDLERLSEKLGAEQSLFMWCAAILGLRWAEVAGLTVNRLNLLGGSITVDRQMSRLGELVAPKSEAGSRTLACPKWLAEDFARVLALRSLSAADGESLVFVNSDGGPLSYTNWRRRVWLKKCAEAEMPGLRFHDLRSLNATALVASGADIKTAQTRLGHSSSRLTLDVYARSTAKADRKAANAVGNILRPSRKDRVNRRSKSGAATA
jgi:integrase